LQADAIKTTSVSVVPGSDSAHGKTCDGPETDFATMVELLPIKTGLVEMKRLVDVEGNV
jgi:hypothetical protein